MAISAAAVRTIASCAQSKRRRPSCVRERHDECPALPGPLNDNPSLDRWVAFPAPGKVTVLTGRVELGQGVLTAMAQIAADELDVAMERITVRSGDTEKAPNEGYTAGSQSIQFGGVALRQALRRSARAVSRSSRESPRLQGQRTLRSRRQHLSQRQIDRTGLLDARRRRRPCSQGDRQPVRAKRVADLKTIGTNSARLDLPAKIFGESVFIHDMQIDGMVHARVVRQPNRGATIGAIDENAIRRAAKGSVRIRAQWQFSRDPRRRRNRRRSGGRRRGESRHLAKRRSADADPARSQLAAATTGGRPASSARRAGRSARPGAL